MAPIGLSVLSSDGVVRAETSGEDDVTLVHRLTYGEGDRIVLTGGDGGAFLHLSLDNALPPALVYLSGAPYALSVPFGPARKAYSPKAFAGELHRLSVRYALPQEISGFRNLSFNPYDHGGNESLFPHADATVITRNEAGFAARNAIDGETANADHGFWPYTSWGINRDPDAALRLDFGRLVEVGAVGFYLRADFPHDAWWEEASLSFSDGSTERFTLEKTGKAQRFDIAARRVSWVRLHSLIKADDPSPFPALTQLEIWGRDLA